MGGTMGFVSGVIYSDTQQRRVSRVFGDLVRARELLWDLTWKELRVRYRYAFLGFLWAIIEPVALMLILTAVFSLVFVDRPGMQTANQGLPYAVVLLSGIVPWLFFSAAISHGTRSVLDAQNLVTKVYFPREIIPISAVTTCLINAVIGFIVLLLVHVIMGGHVGVNLLAFPVMFAIEYILTLGLALLFSSLNVFFRDVGYLTGVALAFGFYASPILYRIEQVTAYSETHPWLVRLYQLNPMAGIITAYREALFTDHWPGLGLWVIPSFWAVVALGTGVWVFRRLSPVLADHV